MTMKNIVKLFLFLGVFSFSSCELDYLDSPNDVTLSSANADYLLNRVQIDFAAFFSGTSSRGGRVTRMYHQASDTYEISHQAVSQNGTWTNAYANMLIDIKNLKVIAEANGFRRHLGIAKTLEAYIWMTLVDQFGDVPFSEALDPGNFYPNKDSGEDIYAAALALLQDAKADFDAASLGSPNDYYFGNNTDKWKRLINTLELRYHLNRKLVPGSGSAAAIQALITADNFLKSGDDFVFRYGTSQADPDSRHPFFAGQYPNGGGDYQSVYYMWHLTEGKKRGAFEPGDASGSPDPRANYYFYRQRGENPVLDSEVRCINEFKPAHYPIDMAWCMPGVRGYWGRDHLDPQGIPPDGLARTLYGLYPGGGWFDDNTPSPMASSKVGNRGAGIQPIMLVAFVDFMLAEAALTLGTPGDPKELMLSGVEKHIEYVRSWSLGTLEASKVTAYIDNDAHETKRDNYLGMVEDDYDDATNDTGRMRIIAREYWISLFGNGNEAYNLYRRTGQPDGMQPGQIPNFGKFPRSFFYPNDYVVLNTNATQKQNHDVQVFWDKNPAGFID
jgi:hypothetical protein